MLRNTSLEQMLEIYKKVSESDVLFLSKEEQILPTGVLGIDVPTGCELHESLMCSTGAIKAKVGMEFNVVTFSQNKAACFTLKNEGTGTTSIRTLMNSQGYELGDAAISSSLSEHVGAECISCFDTWMSPIAVFRVRYLKSLSRETMLYVLRQLGAVSAKDLLGGDGWRERYGVTETQPYADQRTSKNCLHNYADLNWQKYDMRRKGKYARLVAGTVASFPLVQKINRGFTDKGNGEIETLFSGDEVRLISSWSMVDDKPYAELKVLDSKGIDLGYLDWTYEINPLKPGDISSYDMPMSLACLLPHVRASIWKVVPISMRGKTVKEPEVYVRLDIETVDLQALMAELQPLLAMGLEDRELSSCLEVG